MHIKADSILESKIFKKPSLKMSKQVITRAFILQLKKDKTKYMLWKYRLALTISWSETGPKLVTKMSVFTSVTRSDEAGN